MSAAVPADDLPDSPSVVPADDLPQEHQAPTAAAPYDPTQDMSTGDKVLAGIGKGFVDTGRGVYQLGASIGHAAGMVSDEKMAQIQADVDAAHERDKPLMDTTAGKVGDVVGTAAPALVVPGAGIAGGIASGAALGAAQPVATGESRLQNAGLGALGGAAGGAIGKVFKTLGGFGVPLERQAAVDTLTAEGIPTSVAQKTASKGAQTVERASGMVSDAQNEFMARQQPAFNRAVLRRVGVNSDTPVQGSDMFDHLDKADTRIGNVMDAVASRTKPQVDNQFLNDMVSVEHDAHRQLPVSDIGPIKQNISDILENASQNGGYLDGTFVQKLNSNLGALAKNPTTAPIVGDLQEAVHNVVQRYATPGDAKLLATAKGQYRALQQIKPAVDPATGNVSVPKLMSSMNSKTYGSRNQTLYGRGDQSLVDLARAAKTVLPETLGNSGTAERMLAPLTVMEGLRQEGGLLKTAVKAGTAIYGGGALGRAMRSQGAAGHIMAHGLPGVSQVAPAVSNVAPKLGYAAAESKDRDIDQEQPIERAAGGKVDMDALVTRLINRWKAAKKQTDETTKPLLKVPDATIVKALDLAGRAI